MGTFNQNHDSFDTMDDNRCAEVSEFFNDFGLDNVEGTFDEGGNGYWDGYSMINCEPVVRTDQDGYARIIVEFVQDICILANVDDTQNPNICSYDDFTASYLQHCLYLRSQLVTLLIFFLSGLLLSVPN